MSDAPSHIFGGSRPPQRVGPKLVPRIPAPRTRPPCRHCLKRTLFSILKSRQAGLFFTKPPQGRTSNSCTYPAIHHTAQLGLRAVFCQIPVPHIHLGITDSIMDLRLKSIVICRLIFRNNKHGGTDYFFYFRQRLIGGVWPGLQFPIGGNICQGVSAIFK